MSTSPTLRRTFLATVAAGLALSLGACGFVSDTVDDVASRVDAAAREQAAAEQGAGLSRTLVTPIQDDLAALEERIGAPVRLVDLTIGEASYVAQVQDPKHPERVDAYVLDAEGTWGEPSPVRLRGGGTVDERAFAAAEVRWSAVPDLRRTVLDVVPEGDAAVNTISVTRTPFGDVQLYLGAEGTRSSSYLQADAQGTVVRAEQI